MRPAHLLTTHAARAPDTTLVATDAGAWTWGAVLAEVERLAARLSGWAGSRVGVVGSDRDRLVGLLVADRLDASVFLLPDDGVDLPALARVHGLVGIIGSSDGDDALPQPGGGLPGCGGGSVPPGVVIFTSGTTGGPKGALHNWDAVGARVRQTDDLAGSVWLVPPSVRSFAGLQVLLHVLANGGTALVGGGSPADSARLAARHRATHLAGTPTFFRFMLMTALPGHLDALSPRQISLSGEAVDQPLLDRLAARFPTARIGHIYGTTELGACFSVHDGLAGFPSAWLARHPARDVRLSVRDGELFVCSDRRMVGYVGGIASRRSDADGWLATGDQVQVRQDRVVFLGRRSERINVGGVKVYPAQVEAVIASVCGVGAVRVSGMASSLMGQLVQAEVVSTGDLDDDELRTAVLASARAHLAPQMVPRRVRIVPDLDQGPGHKLNRRAT